MTVNAAVNGCSDVQSKPIRTARTKEDCFETPELGDLDGKGVKAVFGEVEMDQESGGSSTEEIESPKSVAAEGMRRGRKKAGFVHNQVMRIRKEDSLIGEDIAEGLGANYKEKSNGRIHHVASPVDVVLFSRPILPCSPLGGKAARRHGLALK